LPSLWSMTGSQVEVIDQTYTLRNGPTQALPVDVMLSMGMFVVFSMASQLSTLALLLFKLFLDRLLRVTMQAVLLLLSLKLMLETVLLQQVFRLPTQR